MDDIGDNYTLIVILMAMILGGLSLHIVRFCAAWCKPYPSQSTTTFAVVGVPASAPPSDMVAGGERQPSMPLESNQAGAQGVYSAVK